MSAPHLSYLHLNPATVNNRSASDPRPPANVVALLRLTTPKGTVREAHLDREQLARLIEAAGAILRRTAPGEEVVGYLWCESEGAVHDDTADPYSYGEPCPGPHHPVYLDTDRS